MPLADARLTLLGLLLLLLGGGLGRTSGGSTGSGGTGSSGGGGTTTGSDVGEHRLDVLALEGLGEEGSPDGLDLDRGGRGDGDDLVGLCECESSDSERASPAWRNND